MTPVMPTAGAVRRLHALVHGSWGRHRQSMPWIQLDGSSLAVPTEPVLPSRCGRLAPLEHGLQLRVGQQAAAAAAHALRRTGGLWATHRAESHVKRLPAGWPGAC